jgi:hypothetical protein
MSISAEQERPGDSRPAAEVNERSGAARIYLIALWVLVAILFVGLIACAPGGSKESTAQSDTQRIGSPDKPLRLLLIGTAAQDSVRTVGDFHVDQVLRQVFDSIAGVRYLTLNYRDSIARAHDPTGKKGVALADLRSALDLDGGINVAVARFGSILALDFGVVDAASGRPRFRELVFQTIRFRDSSGAMLVGPALYDALRTAVGRFVGRKHAKGDVVASAPIVLSSIVIPSDPRLKEISKTREVTSRSILNALNDYAGMHFRELVTFDPISRDRLYETVRIASVVNYLEPKAAERQALFNVGVDRYLVGSIDPVGSDSLRMRIEIRAVVSPTRDTLEQAREMVQPVALVSSSGFEEDAIVAMLDLAEPVFRREADSVTAHYERTRQERVRGAEVR